MFCLFQHVFRQRFLLVTRTDAFWGLSCAGMCEDVCVCKCVHGPTCVHVLYHACVCVFVCSHRSFSIILFSFCPFPYVCLSACKYACMCVCVCVCVRAPHTFTDTVHGVSQT